MKTKIKLANPMKMSKKVWLILRTRKLKNAIWSSGKRLPVNTTAASRNAVKKNVTGSTGWLKKKRIQMNLYTDLKVRTRILMKVTKEVKSLVKSPTRAAFVRY